MSRIAVSPNPKIRTVTITTDDRPHYQSTVDDVDCDPTRINPHTPFVVRHPTTAPQKGSSPRLQAAAAARSWYMRMQNATRTP